MSTTQQMAACPEWSRIQAQAAAHAELVKIAEAYEQGKKDALAAVAEELRNLRRDARVVAQNASGVALAFYNGQKYAFNTAVVLVAHPDEYKRDALQREELAK
jgi:hypothetical protein